jgi:hypothetical protein
VPRLDQILNRVAPQTRGTDAAKPYECPATFLGFCADLNVRLWPGQAEFARVAFDGDQPVDRDVARALFGEVDFENLPLGVRDVVAAVCGGRGGKSYVLVALRLVWGMLVRDLSSLAPGQQAVALVVAPNEELRQEVVNYALGAFRSKPELKALLRLPRGTKEDDTVSEFTIKRPDGHMVTFRGGVATAGGYGGRGKSLTDFAMDEAAFFRDRSAKVNDQDIFQAASPRVLPGGQTIVASTPWAEAGLLYETWRENFGKPSTALVAHAPTTTLNGSEWVARLVERETRKDPDNAAREFGAKFMTGGTTVFYEPALIDAMIDPTLSVDVPRECLPGESVSAGGDLGFRSNSSALAITHQRKTDGAVVLGELIEQIPDPSKRLKPREVLTVWAARLAHHRVKNVMADQHYIETAREDLEASGVNVFDAPASPDEVHVRCRQLMRAGKLKIPNNPRLIRQLKEVQGKPLPGGKMSIVMPRWAKGAHGDLAAAYVLGVWQLVTDAIPAPPPETGSKEWEEAEKRARFEAMEAERNRSHWRARGGGVGAERSRSGR